MRDDTGRDDHWAPLPRPATRARATRASTYVPMRDGVRIAVDVHLPRDARGPMPAIVRQTRYLRALRAAPPFRAIAGAVDVTSVFDLYARTRRVFLAAGYAWVDVDVRGTGASTGAWLCPWSPAEVGDGADVVRWIVSQPWSDGRVGSLGISYDGTCADMLATAGHPAVRAVAPMFALYDVYADVGFPGGIRLAQFVERWAWLNATLDRDAFPDAGALTLFLIGRAGAASPAPRGLERVLAPLVRGDEDRARRTLARAVSRVALGVRPVDGAIPPEARRERQLNMDVMAMSDRVTFRDDTPPNALAPDLTIDAFSPHSLHARAQASGAAVYSYSGWRDGGYPHSAVKRFSAVRTPGSRLTLGPWPHAGKLRIRPFDVAAPTRFDQDAELLAFFDEHVGERPVRGDGAPVHYFTMVEGRWKSATSWPPEGVAWEPAYVGEARALRREPPASERVDELAETGASGTGERSRWRSLLSLVPGDYPDRATRDRGLLAYDGAPLEGDLEVTGHPAVTLFVSSSDDDGHVFAYLEDVSPSGDVAYVTEGQLRLLHRRLAGDGRVAGTGVPLRTFARADAAPLAHGEIAEVAFDLQPISWLFRRGHRVRLALAGADADHFDVMAPRTLRVHSGPSRPSRVDLPVMRRGR